MKAEMSYKNIIMISWLDAFIASKHNNNTQYMHLIYIYIFASPL